MAVQFVIGRAGTGKTQYCVEALAAQSKSDPLGPPLFWLMPEQATFMSEQRLMAMPGMAGSFRIRVLGFRRLCRFLAAELNLPLEPAISPIGRQLLLARAVQLCGDQLTAYQPVANLPGFLARLDCTLREIVQGRQNAERLRAAAAMLRDNAQRTGATTGEAVLAGKLHDLALLLESWDRVKPTGFMDGEMLPGIIENALGSDDRLRDTSIYVDAFSAMNLMEIRFLGLLARKAKQMVITLLADPESPAIVNPGFAPSPMGVFHRTEQLYQRLRRQIQLSGAVMENPIFLHTAHRFTRSPGLAHVESQLFTGGRHHAGRIPSDHAVELRSCQSPEEEVLCAGRRIRALVTAGLRYRDIGVIVSDLAGYDTVIRTTFMTLDIPFFLDQRQSLKFHPLVELLQRMTTLVDHEFSRSDILSLIKTALAGVNDADACILENYFLAHGIERDAMDSDWTWDQLPADEQMGDPSPMDQTNLNRINAVRRTLRRTLEPWITLAANSERPKPVSRFAATLLKLLENLGVSTVMEQWIDKALLDGFPELAQIHEQAWSQCRDMLHEMSALPETHTQTQSGFSDLLRTVLQNLTLGLIPPAMDQVLISSAQRSRHPELKVVMVIGALETLMPKATAEDSMLNDADRRQLQPIFGDSLNSDTAEDFMEAEFFDYIAFTRASEKLLISYPAADADGRATAPSIYISRLTAIFNNLSVQSLESTDIRWHDFAALDELIRWVLLAIRNSSAGAPDAGNPATVQTAYQWLSTHADPVIRQRWQQAAAAQNRQNLAPLPAELGRFGLGSSVVSVSELETYAACPLKHFYSYTLRLRERPEWQMDARNLGIMYHQALDRFYQEVIGNRLPWPQCRDEQFHQALANAIEKSTQNLSADVLAGALELQAVIKPMQRQLAIILEAQRRAAGVNKLRPVATELRFGTFPHTDPAVPALPAITLLADRGTTIELRGKIDRLDMDPAGNAMLVDYKSGGKTFKIGQFIHGLDLQLIAYMLAVRGQAIHGHGPLEPIAAFYYLLRPPELPVEPEPDEKPLAITDSGYFKNCRPDGPFDNDAIAVLDSSVDSGQSSAWFKIALAKGRRPHGGRNGGLDHALFSAMLDFGLEIMRLLAKSMRSGNVGPWPYKAGQATACSTCDFKSICPFDRQRGQYRLIDTGGTNARAMLLSTIQGQTVEQI